jgi:hypothetical protein
VTEREKEERRHTHTHTERERERQREREERARVCVPLSATLYAFFVVIPFSLSVSLFLSLSFSLALFVCACVSPDDMKDLVHLMKRVSFSVPVNVCLLNQSANFWAQSTVLMSQTVALAQQRLGIQDAVDPRFYFIPPTGVQDRVVIRNQAEWERFFEESANEGRTPKLYFVCVGDSPPALYPPRPLSPPRADLEAPDQSEPSASPSLKDRDEHVCKVCGQDVTEGCHILDKARAELMVNLGDINDTRNLLLLCPNHHTEFDNFQFTLVAETSDPECLRYIVSPTPQTRSPPSRCLRDHFAQVVEFSGGGDNAPLPHLFLLKQLGRFKVPCSECDRSFASSAWAQHMTKSHPDKKATTRPLPRICSCSGTDDLSAQELYDHAIGEHLGLLYSFPDTVRDGTKAQANASDGGGVTMMPEASE